MPRQTQSISFPMTRTASTCTMDIANTSKLMWLVDTGWMLLTFIIAALLIPIILCLSIVVQTSRKCWIKLIRWFYARDGVYFFETYSFRSLIETNRNQGIITFLVSVNGKFDARLVRDALQNLLDRRDKCDSYMHPRLRQCLVSHWGCYAWKRTDFNLDQHLIIANNVFRGRPISEANLQDYVSDQVRKYLAPDIPPWQIFIIPNSTLMDNSYHILLRVHHLLLDEEKHLRISDMLMLHTDLNTSYTYSKSPDLNSKPSEFTNVIPKPRAIFQLYDQIRVTFANTCNEFIATYDPLENIALLKQTPTIFTFVASIFATIIACAMDFHRTASNISTNPLNKLKYAWNLFKRELSRRNLNMSTFGISLLKSISPVFLTILVARVILRVYVAILKIPIYIYQEMITVFDVYFSKTSRYTNTFTYLIYTYVPLVWQATGEFLKICQIVIETPRNVLNEIIASKFGKQTKITVPLTGRKVMAWTPKVPKRLIKQVAAKLKVSDSAVLLAACSAGLNEFFAKSNVTIPNYYSLFAQNINKNYLYSAYDDDDAKRGDIGGVLCMSVPSVKNGEPTRIVDNLREIDFSISMAKRQQVLMFYLIELQMRHNLLSKCLPTILITVLINYLSRMYSIAFTEMTSADDFENFKRTRWGDRVTGVIYVRPPQANVCLSLCLTSFEDTYTLGVMTDAFVSPAHFDLRNEFVLYLNKLIEM